MRSTHVARLAVVLAVAAAMLAFGWVGFMASDDPMYAAAAQRWVEEFPYLGQNHWGLRHTFVLPAAASFALFGVSELSLVAVNILYFLALLLVIYAGAARVLGGATATWMAAVVATVPLLAVWATIPGADLAEATFVVLSVVLLSRAIDKESTATFFWAGIAAGLAWLTRETAVALVVFYGLLFVLGYGTPRRQYLVVALGFALVALGEITIYYAVTGDPLYRVWIDIAQNRGNPEAVGQVLPGSGNVQLNRLLDPLLALVANQEFMLVYVLFVPAAVWVLRTDRLQGEGRRFAVLLVGLAATWALVLAYLFPVRELPRYFSASTAAAAAVVALWLVEGVLPSRRWLGGIGLALFVGTNLLGIYVENKDPIFAERRLVDWTSEHRQPVHTDPATATAAGFLLRSQGVADLVSKDPPPIGALYLYNPQRVTQPARGGAAYTKQYSPRPDWVEVQRFDPGRKASGVVLEWLGVSRFVPPYVWQRLNKPLADVVIYRVTSELSPTAP